MGRGDTDFHGHVRGRANWVRSGGSLPLALIGFAVVATLSFIVRDLTSSGSSTPTSAPQPTLQPLASEADVGWVFQVETSVVARPTVPAALADRGWFSSSYGLWQAGELGSTARIELADEVPIAAAGTRVATVINGPLYARERSSILRIRDIRTGAVLTEIKSRLYIDIARFAGDYLFYSGTDVNRAGDGEPEIYPGGGLLAVESSGKGDVVEVIPPEPVLRMSVAPFGDGIRAPLVLSQTGQTLASAVYLDGGATGRVDVVDVATLKTRTTLPKYAYAISDNFALVRGAADTSQDVALVDLRSGEPSWVSMLNDNNLGPVMILSVVADDDRIVLQYELGSLLIVGTIDTTSGSVRQLLVQDGADANTVPLYMEPSLSSASTIVLLEAPGAAAAIEAAGGRALATVLDVETGKLTDAAFAIGAP